MNVTSWAASHRRSIFFLLLVLVLGGILSATGLPVALFPSVNFPRIVVNIEAGDRPASEMVFNITRPVEAAVRSVPGVRDIRSTTSRGSAELSVNFAWGEDMAVAALRVEAAISQLLPSLPSGIGFQARRMDPTVFPVAAYSLTSNNVDLVKLRDIASYELVPLLSAVPGVAQVGVLGGDEEEYRVEADSARLAGLNLTLNDLVMALSATNELKAVGRLEDEHKLFLVLGNTRIRSMADIRQTIVRSGEDGLVQLDDVATVSRSVMPRWIIVSADGQNAVSVQIFQQPGGNTVKIVSGLADALQGYNAKLPEGVSINQWYDQSVLITESAASVRDAILIGVGLAAIVLLVFLRSWKTTLIAIIAVPAALASSVLVLKLLGMSFNIMTMGGMAAAIGLVIDDAIVMIEQIVRNLNPAAKSQHEVIRKATRQFFHPLSGSSASTVIVFAPLAFLSGVTGAFFKALSLTMVSALVFSFFVAWFAIPLIADHLLSQKNAEKENDVRGNWLQSGYTAVMGRLLRVPALALVAIAILVGAGYFAYTQVGSGFMPRMDEGGFILDYRAPAGTSLAETDFMIRQVETILAGVPDVKAWSRRTGAQLGGGITEVNEGDFFVRLKPLPRRPIDVVMADVDHRVAEQVPGLDIDMAQLMEDLIGDLTAVPQPIEIKIFGDDEERLLATAPKVATAIGRIPGVIDVRNGIVLAGDALDILVDRKLVALYGLDPNAVTNQVQTYLSGIIATTVQQGVKSVGIRVWVPPTSRGTVSAIEDITIRAPNGRLVPVEAIATINRVSGQPQITRDDLKPMVAVTGRIQGRDLGSTIADVKNILQQNKDLFTGGLYYELGGLYQQQQIAFRGLMLVIIAAFALVFLLLVFLYESMRIAIVIISMPLFALAAVFIGLWLTGTELNITALMGTTMIVGIVTEVAIFFFSEYRKVDKDGRDLRQALVQAGASRLRPILMTTLAAIFALMPLALGIGQGSAMQKPLAVAIISGLIAQVPLVLFVMPVLFSMLSARKRGI